MTCDNMVWFLLNFEQDHQGGQPDGTTDGWNWQLRRRRFSLGCKRQFQHTIEKFIVQEMHSMNVYPLKMQLQKKFNKKICPFHTLLHLQKSNKSGKFAYKRIKRKKHIGHILWFANELAEASLNKKQIDLWVRTSKPPR